jgi:very-short-patch-repair endonuclease
MTDDAKYKWPMSNTDIARRFGVSEGTIRGHQSRYKKYFIRGKGKDYWGEDLGVPNAPTPMTVWSKEGAIKLAHYCGRSTKAGIFLEEMGVIKRRISHVESASMDIITSAIDGHTRYKRQYPVGPYKVDLYLLDLKVAIECDEQGHRYRNKLMEGWRQKMIEEELKCKFIRFNLDKSNFNVGRIVNEIFTLILAKKDE